MDVRTYFSSALITGSRSCSGGAHWATGSSTTQARYFRRQFVEFRYISRTHSLPSQQITRVSAVPRLLQTQEAKEILIRPIRSKRNMSFRRGRGRSGTASNEASQALRKAGVVHHIKESSSSVLTARAVRTGSSPLLIHVAENRIMFVPAGRYSNFGVIKICSGASGQAEFLPCPLSRRGNLHGSRLRERIVPTSDGRG